MQEQPLLLKAEQGAALLGISRSKFFALMAAGELPGIVRIGRSVRISRTALEAWIRQQSGEGDDDQSVA